MGRDVEFSAVLRILGEIAGEERLAARVLLASSVNSKWRRTRRESDGRSATRRAVRALALEAVTEALTLLAAGAVATLRHWPAEPPALAVAELRAGLRALTLEVETAADAVEKGSGREREGREAMLVG